MTRLFKEKKPSNQTWHLSKLIRGITKNVEGMFLGPGKEEAERYILSNSSPLEPGNSNLFFISRSEEDLAESKFEQKMILQLLR